MSSETHYHLDFKFFPSAGALIYNAGRILLVVKSDLGSQISIDFSIGGHFKKIED